MRDRRGAVMMRSVPDVGLPALCAYRPELIRTLANQLPKGTLRLGAAVARVHSEGVQLEDGTEAVADVVIGADGLRSKVRDFVFGEGHRPIYRGYVVWRGMTRMPSSVVEGEVFESWGRGQRFGLFGAGQGRAYWYATANKPEGAVESDGARKHELQRRFADWHEPIQEVIDSTGEAAILCGNTYDLRPRPGWSRGRAVLIGDAAHASTPNLGQGGCMALEDALVLARCLGAAPSPADGFQEFERARFRRTRRVTRESLWIGRLGQAAGVFATARDLFSRLTPGTMQADRQRSLFDYDADAVSLACGKA
ncbi:MAG: FAD-dependent monooxygenase [Myxococcota bacterium]